MYDWKCVVDWVGVLFFQDIGFWGASDEGGEVAGELPKKINSMLPYQSRAYPRTGRCSR